MAANQAKPRKTKKYPTYKPPEIPKPVKIPAPVIDWGININTKTDSARPVDYTFKKYKHLKKTPVEYASSGRLGLIDRGPGMRYMSRSLWLNNNFFENVHNLHCMVDSVMEFPDRLGFLDLSCNEIKEISDDILKYANITVLYLHGNNLRHLIDLVQLSKLKKLKSLTYYGNPLYKDKSYGNIRVVVAQFIPQLKKLDFNGITKLEQECPMSQRALKFRNTFNNRIKEIKKEKGESAYSIDGLRKEQFEPWRDKWNEGIRLWEEKLMKLRGHKKEEKKKEQKPAVEAGKELKKHEGKTDLMKGICKEDDCTCEKCQAK